MLRFNTLPYQYSQVHKLQISKALAFSIFIFFSCNNSNHKANFKEEFTGKVIGIIDGDTYDLLIEDSITFRIRMEGIDAPEKGMPYCNVAKKYLSSLCFGKMIRLAGNKKDRNNRIIAYSYLEDGTELSHEMVKAGLAWHFKKYSSDTSLANLELEARNLVLGLWKDQNPIAPWEIRKLHRDGVSTKNFFNIKVE